jgi:hypothetical protein
MQFSYSLIQQFLTCPRQYYEMKVAKNYKDTPNEKTIYGRAVHKAIEDYIKTDTKMPSNYGEFAKTVDKVRAVLPDNKGDAEVRLAVDGEMNPVPYFDPSVVMRGIIDFLVIEKDVAWMVDWKLGNEFYADHKQLDMLALLIFYCYPQIKLVKSFLMFLPNNHFLPNADRERNDIPAIWEKFSTPLTRMAFAHKTGQWPENPSGLCRKHCPVLSCQYNGRR